MMNIIRIFRRSKRVAVGTRLYIRVNTGSCERRRRIPVVIVGQTCITVPVASCASSTILGCPFEHDALCSGRASVTWTVYHGQLAVYRFGQSSRET